MGLSRSSSKHTNLRKRVSRINNSFQTTDESMKRQTFSWKIFFSHKFEILRTTPHKKCPWRMREDMDLKNPKYGHFSRNANLQ